MRSDPSFFRYEVWGWGEKDFEEWRALEDEDRDSQQDEDYEAMVEASGEGGLSPCATST